MTYRRTAALVAALLALPSTAVADVPVSLRGSPESMLRQNRVAREMRLPFFRTPADVRSALMTGKLVMMGGNRDYAFKATVNPVARVEVATFIEEVAAEFREGCGEQLVVTSLTRPLTRQPSNAHPLSVHPAGIAIDLRVPRTVRCRVWLEGRFLQLEEQGVLDITREYRPPHYHVALFPAQYMALLEAERRAARGVTLAAEVATPATEPEIQVQPSSPASYSLLPTGPMGPSERAEGGASVLVWIGKLITLPVRVFTLLLS